MDRFVMRHPDTGGTALVPESSLRLHKGQGWLRVSDAVAEEDMHRVDATAYAQAPDLDAAPDQSAPAKPVLKTSPAKSIEEQ